MEEERGFLLRRAVDALAQIAGGATDHDTWYAGCVGNIMDHFKNTLATMDVGNIDGHVQRAQQAWGAK